MPHAARASVRGLCYNVINRGNAQIELSHVDGNYRAFVELIRLACERIRMRVLAFRVMPNHFHLALWPLLDRDHRRWMPFHNLVAISFPRRICHALASRFLVFFFFFALVNASSSQAASPPTRVVLSSASFSEKEGAFFVAEDQGFFQKYGLDVKHVYMRTGSVALSALASGDAQFYSGSPTATTLGAFTGGLDGVFVAGLINKLSGAFVVDPSIRNPSDLKNRTIGVQSIGGGHWMITMLVLNHWGLDPKRDNIQLRVLGDYSVLAQSIVARIIDGAHLSYTFAANVERQGFRILADELKLGIPYQNTAIITRRSFVNSSPQVVERLLRALVDAVTFVLEPDNKAAVMKSLARGLRLPRVADAAEGYEGMISLYERRMYPTVAGIRNAIQLLGTTNEKIRSLKAEDLVNDSFIKKLEQEAR
jgi:ABC-type nitrate/sulfonate/bicarbonate transport system substrate-binding protein